MPALGGSLALVHRLHVTGLQQYKLQPTENYRSTSLQVVPGRLSSDKLPVVLGKNFPNTTRVCVHLTDSLPELHKHHSVLSRWPDADWRLGAAP